MKLTAVVHILLISVLLSYRQVASVAIDNDIMGEPDIECLDEEIRVWVKTRKLFAGRMYAKGRSEVPECIKDDYTQQRTDKPHFDLKFGACGMKSLRSVDPRGMYYGITIVVSFHSMYVQSLLSGENFMRAKFITKVDQAFHVKCFFEEANRGLTAELGVSMIPTTEVNARHGIPGCTYSIHRSTIQDLDAGRQAGEPIQFARVGDKVLHQWHCDDQMFGILINNCYVTDGFGKRADVVDSRGCPVDPILITGIRYSQDLQRAYAESHVFKFADKPGVWFFCQIQMCMKGPGMCNGITPPSCAAAEVDGGHGHEAGPPMIATLPLPGPTFTGNGGNTGTTGASYGVSGYGGSTGYGGGVTGGFTQPRAQGPGPGFGLSNAPLQQPFTAFGPALPPDQHSESTVGNTHGGTFGVLGNKKEVTAIYETRDLPYQSSAAIAKGSTRASTYQFDTPSVTFEKTSYVPSSPASFIPTSPEEEEGAEEGEGPVSGATDEEMEADGDGHDVTLPSDLSDLLGQLPEGEVDMEGVEEIFRDSVDDRRALLDKFGKLLNKMKKKAHAPPPKKKQMGRGSSAKAAMPGDRLDSMQVSWESSGPKFAKMAADAPPPAAPNDDSVKDGPPEIAGQLIIFDLDEDPPSYMQLSRSHVDEDENGTLSSSFSSSDVLPDGTPLSAPCVISRNGLTTLATVLGGLAALFFFIACALCMRVCRTRKDNSMPDKSISYNLYDDRAPPPGMRKVSRSRSREHNGDREHRRHHSRR